MVKILQAYNFAKQNTFSLNGDILSATLINSNRIAISSAEQFIEIYDIGCKQQQQQQQQHGNEVIPPSLDGRNDGTNATSETATSTTSSTNDERMPTKYSLATVGEVVQLIYCEAGKYLLTLEKENIASPMQTNTTSISCTSSSNTNTAYSEDDIKMFVRIYANFLKFPEEKLIVLPITIRIASMTTPKTPLIESIDVIELPLRSPPDLIQCCQTSGNIIVSSKERIYLYEYTQCTHETTQPRFSYIDFLPFKFFVNLNFVPLKLCLAENVIACMNNRYCVAFKIIDVLSSSSGGGVSSNSFDNNYDVDDAAADIDTICSSESSIVSKASAGAGGICGLGTNAIGAGGGGGGGGGGCTSSHNSFESDSLDTTSSDRLININGFPQRTPIDFNVARIINSACGREFEVDLKSQWEKSESLSGTNGINCSNGGVDAQDIIIIPTRANEIKIKLVNEAKAMNVQRIFNENNIISLHNDDTTVQYDVRKLLQICMKTSESSGRIVDILRCMDLKAIYQRNANATADADAEYEMGNQEVPGAVSSSKHANRRTLKSNLHQSCVGYALLIASSVDGYLYQFSAQGKWYNENEKPIATYAFTAPVLRVHINDYVIYAITTESVETHTSRIGHKLFNNRFEYPSTGNLFPEESSPDINASITVIGLCSFMHVQFVCLNRDNLILISNSNPAVNGAVDTSSNSSIKKRTSSGGGSEVKRSIAARLIAEAKAKHNLLRNGSVAQQPICNEWTLYNLALPQVEDVIRDLEGIAETYRTASSTNFYNLMEEAHVMLRLSLLLHFEKLTAERELQLREKFMINCRKLANFSIRSPKKDIYLQATGFYKMCNLHLTDIYANYIEDLENEKPEKNAICGEQLVGLIYTVKSFLLHIGTDRAASTFLNQSVKPFFSRNRKCEKDSKATAAAAAGAGATQVPLSLEILKMFIKYSPADIPQIMLNSPIVADSVSGELINYLKQLNKLSPDENLLLAVTACRMSNYILSQEMIASRTTRHNLATSLMKYKNVLFDDGTLLFQKHRSIVDSTKYSTTTTTGGSHSSSSTNAQVPYARCNNKILRRHQLKSSNKSTTTGQDATHNAGTSLTQSQLVASFSDFTETILLATENVDLIEAISDVFIHALCIEHSITLDIILQLFLNYIASHIGHKGYQSSQKVLMNILQVYYYDYFDINLMPVPSDLHSIISPPPPVPSAPHVDNGSGHGDGDDDDADYDYDKDDSSSKAPSINGGNESITESNSIASSSIEERCYVGNSKPNRIIYNHLQEQQSPYKRNSNASLHNHDAAAAAAPAAAAAAAADDDDDVDCHATAALDDGETNLKGLKILFRMYLGRLKVLSDLTIDLQSADVEQQHATNDEFLNLRMECIKFMIRHLQEMRISVTASQQPQSQRSRRNHITKYYYYPHTKMPSYHHHQQQQQQQQQQADGTNANEKKNIFVPFIPDYKLTGDEYEQHIKSYIRPIPCLLERPQYLNRLPPFQRTDFSFPNKDDGETEVHFIAWHNELLTITLKIQSLLATPKIDREIIEEFIAFIQKTPNLIGIDSFLVIILPKNLAINYMMNFCPEYLWQYGKSNNFIPKHWESLFRKILSKQTILPNWREHIIEILNNLVDELTFEELLQCFPTEAVQSDKKEILLKEFCDHRISYAHGKLIFDAQKDTVRDEQKLSREHLPMDNIDENNVFELALRKAVAKQRSIALRSMIESTGTQLFDATNNPMYNL